MTVFFQDNVTMFLQHKFWDSQDKHKAPWYETWQMAFFVLIGQIKFKCNPVIFLSHAV